MTIDRMWIELPFESQGARAGAHLLQSMQVAQEVLESLAVNTHK